MNDLVHCGICLNNCFVSLEHHGLSLLGGWQFGVKNGNKMIGTTREIFENLPPLTKDKKIANFMIDVDASKMLVKKLLNANTFLQLKNICSEDMAEFLSHTKNSPNLALDELKNWETARSKTFPEHKFVKIKEIGPDDVFK